MRKRLAGIAIVASTALVLSGCAVGFDAQTGRQKPSGDGRSATAGDIKVRGLTIVFDPAHPTFATLVATINNAGTTADSLEDITGDDVVPQTGLPVKLPALHTVSIGFGSTLRIPLRTAVNPLVAGTSTPVTLYFQNAPSITIPHVMVNANTGDFSDVQIPEVIIG